MADASTAISAPKLVSTEGRQFYEIRLQRNFDSRSRLGRFVSPDPIPGDIRHPQSQNRYTYVRNNPCGATDPLGLCDVIVGGFEQDAFSADSREQSAFADEIRANLVFPYAGGGVAGGLADVAHQAVGIGGEEAMAVMNAIYDAAKDPGPINVYLFSGGGQAFSTAFKFLPDEVKGRINNVTYISPGGISLPEYGSGTKTMIYNQSPFSLDSAINPSGGPQLSPAGVTFVNTSCGHSANCSFAQQRALLTSLKGRKCSNPQTYERGDGSERNWRGIFGVRRVPYWYVFAHRFASWVSSVGPIAVVTTKIVPL